MSDVTRILLAIDEGDAQAADQLLPLVYHELRRLAASKMSHEKSDHTLQGTALVHEAYLRLVNSGEHSNWNSRGHFYAAAAESMRRILIDRARQKRTARHGGNLNRIEIEQIDDAGDEQDEELLALDEALGRFAQEHPKKAELVKLRYFVGLTIAEAARLLRISESTADRYWAYSRAWLHHEMTK